jgi:hypothetical protein
MKKFKFFDDIREADPSEENKIIIATLDTVIERICKIHSFQSMFENIGYSEYFPKKMDNESQYRYGDFKDFLEENFVAMNKANKYGMFPPLFFWVLEFKTIEIKITKEQTQDLLLKNFNLYKEHIEPYLEDFKLTSSLYYDLTIDKFISYI